MSDEIIGRSFAVFGLAMFMVAYLVNRAALRLLDEAKTQADLWGDRLNEAVALAEEAKVIHENALRLRGRPQVGTGNQGAPPSLATFPSEAP